MYMCVGQDLHPKVLFHFFSHANLVLNFLINIRRLNQLGGHVLPVHYFVFNYRVWHVSIKVLEQDI